MFESRPEPGRTTLTKIPVASTTTILVIEKNDFLRRTLRWWLKTKFSYCHVVEATNGEDGLELARRHSPEVAIVDITLPEDGHQTIERLKAITSKVKIVALTFREDEIDYIDVKSDGVTAYISHEKIQLTLYPTLEKLLTNSDGDDQRN